METDFIAEQTDPRDFAEANRAEEYTLICESVLEALSFRSSHFGVALGMMGGHR